MDGRKPPSRKRPFPFSQIDSIFDRDKDKSFSLTAAACGFRGRPNTGASTLLRINPAETIIVE
jgi:hypothetical protein